MGQYTTLRLALLAALWVASCRSVDDRDRSWNDPDGRGGLVGAAIELPTRPELVAIHRAEAGRSLAGGALLEFLSDPDALVRSRAAVALGRLPFPRYGEEVSRALSGALSDPAPAVRAAAAFALGQRRDPKTASNLLAAWNDSDPVVRARLVEAGARLDDPDLRRRVLASLSDPDVSVASEAIFGAAHWTPDGPDRDTVDRALFTPLVAIPGASGQVVPAELRWKLIYALQQRRSELGRAAFLEFAQSPEVDERMFAIKGLGRLEPRPASARALERALADPDWRLAAEAALGLAAHGDPDSVPRLLEAQSHPSSHVRGSVLRALGNFRAQREAVLPGILRGTKDASPGVRAAALVALATVSSASHGDSVRAELQKHLRDRDPVLRAAVARAAALLPAPMATEMLLGLSVDTHPLVAGDALRGLGTVGGEAALERLREALAGSPDLGLRLVALTAFAPSAGPQDAALVARAVDGAHGDVSHELWLEALATLRQVGGEPARALALRALEHPWYGIRDAGRELLRVSFPSTYLEIPPESELQPQDVPVAGVDFPRWTTNPLVEIETTRGRMVFELFPVEAPLHVYNFLTLGEKGVYEGLNFHRVVANFVVQGGDPRGDGNGGLSWRGEPLPQEFTARPFQRGALGMPRSAHPDSGGCQIFITHRPTAHLDGNYTLFGELRRGFDVLDRLELGDRILAVRALPAR